MIRQTWSVNRLATELQIDRRALAKQLEGVRTAKETETGRGIDREYHLTDVVRALYLDGSGARLDPQQEKARLDKLRADQIADAIAVKRRELIDVEQYRTALSAVLKTVATTLESLPDLLERDAGLPGAAVARAVVTIDALRETLFKAICAAADAMEGEGR